MRNREIITSSLSVRNEEGGGRQFSYAGPVIRAKGRKIKYRYRGKDQTTTGKRRILANLNSIVKKGQNQKRRSIS